VIQLRRLLATDELTALACGDDDLDDFLQSDAMRLDAADASRIYEAARESSVVGYLALLADRVELKSPEKRKLHLAHDDPRDIPAVKVGRLAVDRAFREQNAGTGTLRMRLAGESALTVRQAVGCRRLTVDAYPRRGRVLRTPGVRAEQGAAIDGVGGGACTQCQGDDQHAPDLRADAPPPWTRGQIA